MSNVIELEQPTFSNVEGFPQFLKALRADKGWTLEEACNRLEANSSKNGKSIRKSLLAQMEKRVPSTLKKDIAKQISALYGVDIREVVRRWVDSYYFDQGNSNIVSYYDADKLLLKAPRDPRTFKDIQRNLTETRGLRIITLQSLRVLQGDLPSGSVVYVAATDFLDDDVFFEMVVANLKKGVKYLYCLTEKSAYDGFKEMLGEKVPELNAKLSSLIRFVPRVIHDLTGEPEERDPFIEGPSFSNEQMEFPTNCVVHRHADGSRQGFFGMLIEDRPAYYQVADPALTWRMFAAFNGRAQIAIHE